MFTIGTATGTQCGNVSPTPGGRLIYVYAAAPPARPAPEIAPAICFRDFRKIHVDTCSFQELIEYNIHHRDRDACTTGLGVNCGFAAGHIALTVA